MPAADRTARPPFSDDLDLIRDAAREAGQIALKYFGADPEVWLKGGTSPVSEADYAADAYLRDTLLAARPDYGWLSEESADDLARLKAARTFVVDPIDGTRGFLAGQDEWCVSVAVVESGRSIAGVLECPARNLAYWATDGGGAFKDGVALAMRESVAGLRVGGPATMIDALPANWKASVSKARYVPSLASRIAMVADGTLDATFVRPNSRDWDLAAADLILHEAGGRLLDSSGRPPVYARADTHHGSLVAGSGDLLAAMAATIRGLD